MKIQAINNYHFNRINFESKKSNNIQSAGHATAPLKAIPVALLMAMSPVNMAKAQVSPLDNPIWKFYYNPKNIVIGQDKIECATPDNEYNCTLKYMSNNGNDDTAEILRFVFEKYADESIKDGDQTTYLTKHFTKEVNMSSLVKEEHNIKNGDGTTTQFFKYYIEGPGTERTVTRDCDTERVIRSSSAQLNNVSVEITKEFYDELLPVMAIMQCNTK